jgi:phosphomannomutase
MHGQPQPAADNGYKVYLGDGAQIIPPIDAQIADCIAEVAASGQPVELAPADHPGIDRLDDTVIDAYVRHVTALARPGARELTIVYTPMHGVGGAITPRVLRDAGFVAVHPVVDQADPDPDFPTVAFPNPEEPGALDPAVATAQQVGADLVSPTIPTPTAWGGGAGSRVGAQPDGLAEPVGQRDRCPAG